MTSRLTVLLGLVLAACGSDLPVVPQPTTIVSLVVAPDTGFWLGQSVPLSSLVTGAVTGATYALLQRPECGYTGSLICW